MDSTLDLRLKRTLTVAGLVVLVACLYALISTVITLKTTGLVVVTSSVSQASISISQTDHEAKIIGTGSAKVRLKPGLYHVRGYVGRDSAIETVEVTKSKAAKVSLRLSETPRIHSVDDVDFNGMSSLTANGLSEDQTTSLKLAFFRFKTSAETVTIDGASFKPGARNPATSIGFNATLNVTVDSDSYKATITYSGLSDINLSLYSPQGNSLVFNSDAAPAQEGD